MEVADGIPGLVPVRDSKVQRGDVVVFTAVAWSRFISDAKSS
ncbi:DUF397 domain-containing protein [Streptomyces sp. YIM 130001]|nr:DUF397 domain-containing protein [Streptomyces sp. YIM 130001]